jgi:hypothetical protein
MEKIKIAIRTVLNYNVNINKMINMSNEYIVNNRIFLKIR